MKKHILHPILIFLFLLIAGGSYSQNEKTISQVASSDPLFPSAPVTPASSTFDVSDIYFLNQDTAVAVGKNGLAWKSVNGGLSWASMPTFTLTENNNAVYLEDDYICIAGDHGLVTFSPDAGLTWQNAAAAQFNINYHGVDFADTTFGIAVGDLGDAVIYNWSGSFGWTHSPSGLSKNLNAVASFKTSSNPLADGTAIAVGDTGAVVLYQSGSWTVLSNAITTNINGIYLFPDHLTAIAVGDSGLIIRTSDLGTTWTTLNFGVHEDLHDISEGVTSNQFVAVGDSGVMYVSYDSGNTFSRYTSGFAGSDLKGVSAKNPRGSFGGSGNTLRSFNVDSLSAIANISDLLKVSVGPNPVSTVLCVDICGDPSAKTIQLYNAQFSQLHSERVRSGKNYLDVSALSPGVYFLIVEGRARKVIVDR